MSRVHDLIPAQAIGQALELIPARLRNLTGCEFVVGVNPVFAGIHCYGDEYAPEGHTYGDIAHCVQDIHQWLRPASDRTTKIILPSHRGYQWDTWAGVHTVVHELGHVVHYNTEPSWAADPVSDYAHTNHMEAFAEAFAAWVWGDPIDPRTAGLLDTLAA